MGKKDLKYISTRLVERKSSKAFRDGAKKAMEINGYVVIAQDGWIVKKHSNGKIIKIKEIDHGTGSQGLILD